MILIVGATGYLGNASARRLLAAGESVRAMTLNQYPMELTRLEDLVQDRVVEFAAGRVGLAGA